ncbi:hypothetical protein PsorP6_014423 [Peronosclerospora sorghi]|uniref:Uncharacterized protein n=1 Tax=Peronosclerospora sorghi TaxID=230839 RepID=A0ACC0VHR9_9STRA|nr:hypothetical protein PsorP6_014423 [Peronosclerospora sorghi]
MTKKEKIVDALLDDYVPSNGGYVAGLRRVVVCLRVLRQCRIENESAVRIVTRIQVRLDLYDDAEAQSLASYTVLALGDIELLDYISTSQTQKIVCYWKSEVAHPRESGSSMVRVQVMTVLPGAKLCEEHRLKARFLPLRINLDQEVVKFLRQFVPMDYEASTRKTLKTETISARLQLATFCARAGTSVPSKLLQMTGTEAAVETHELLHLFAIRRATIVIGTRRSLQLGSEIADRRTEKIAQGRNHFPELFDLLLAISNRLIK